MTENSSLHFPQLTHYCDELSTFTASTVEEITKVVLDLTDKKCDLHLIPTSILRKCIHHLAPIIVLIINRSLSSAIFPQTFKHAIAPPLLKKSTLDKDIQL